MVLKTAAKVNIILKIVGKSGGFHGLYSVVCLIDLLDKIEFINSAVGDIEVESKLNLREDDIAFKAVMLCREYAHKGQGIKIKIEKQIPVGAGLGGASSDAAAVIMALNEIWNLDLSKRQINNIALRCGSDVPLFFENSGFVLIEGQGEKVTSLALDCRLYFILIYPNANVSTKFAYMWFDQLTTVEIDTIKPLPDIVDFQVLSRFAVNDLEKPVSCNVFGVKDALLDMRSTAEGNPVFMTGSGSSVVAMFENEREREDCLSRLKVRAGWSYYKADSIENPLFGI